MKYSDWLEQQEHPYKMTNRLFELNDIGKTFEEIANVIERFL